jgi:hypothetical protein
MASGHESACAGETPTPPPSASSVAGFLFALRGLLYRHGARGRESAWPADTRAPARARHPRHLQLRLHACGWGSRGAGCLYIHGTRGCESAWPADTRATARARRPRHPQVHLQSCGWFSRRGVFCIDTARAGVNQHGQRTRERLRGRDAHATFKCIFSRGILVRTGGLLYRHGVRGCESAWPADTRAIARARRPRHLQLRLHACGWGSRGAGCLYRHGTRGIPSARPADTRATARARRPRHLQLRLHARGVYSRRVDPMYRRAEMLAPAMGSAWGLVARCRVCRG